MPFKVTEQMRSPRETVGKEAADPRRSPEQCQHSVFVKRRHVTAGG